MDLFEQHQEQQRALARLAKRCRLGDHAFDPVTAACTRKGCKATLTRDLFGVDPKTGEVDPRTAQRGLFGNPSGAELEEVLAGAGEVDREVLVGLTPFQRELLDVVAWMDRSFTSSELARELGRRRIQIEPGLRALAKRGLVTVEKERRGRNRRRINVWTPTVAGRHALMLDQRQGAIAEAEDVSFDFGALAPEGPAPRPDDVVDIDVADLEDGGVEVRAHDPASGTRVGRLRVFRDPGQAHDPRLFGAAEDVYAPVESAWVAPGWEAARRRLYEVAADEAARRGFPLASAADRTYRGSRFWARQRRKGRAELERVGGGSRYVLDYPPPEALNPPRRVCAWCEREIAAGDDPPTHGICPECYARQLEELRRERRKENPMTCHACGASHGAHAPSCPYRRANPYPHPTALAAFQGRYGDERGKLIHAQWLEGLCGVEQAGASPAPAPRPEPQRVRIKTAHRPSRKEWTKLVTGIDRTKRGGWAVLGEFLPNGYVDVEDGDVFVETDVTSSGKNKTARVYVADATDPDDDGSFKRIVLPWTRWPHNTPIVLDAVEEALAAGGVRANPPPEDDWDLDWDLMRRIERARARGLVPGSRAVRPASRGRGRRPGYQVHVWTEDPGFVPMWTPVGPVYPDRHEAELAASGRAEVGGAYRPVPLAYHNPPAGDARMRELKRQAMAGDPAAKAALDRERARRLAPQREAAASGAVGTEPMYVVDLLERAGLDPYGFRHSDHSRAMRAVLKRHGGKGLSLTVSKGGHTFSHDLRPPKGRQRFGAALAKAIRSALGLSVRDTDSFEYFHVLNRRDQTDLHTDYHHPAGALIQPQDQQLYLDTLTKAARGKRSKKTPKGTVEWVVDPSAGPDWPWHLREGLRLQLDSPKGVWYVGTVADDSGRTNHVLHKVGRKGELLKVGARGNMIGVHPRSLVRAAQTGEARPVVPSSEAPGGGLSPGAVRPGQAQLRAHDWPGIHLAQGFRDPSRTNVYLESEPYGDLVVQALGLAGLSHDRSQRRVTVEAPLHEVALALADHGLQPSSGHPEMGESLGMNPGALIASVTNPPRRRKKARTTKKKGRKKKRAARKPKRRPRRANPGRKAKRISIAQARALAGDGFDQAAARHAELHGFAPDAAYVVDVDDGEDGTRAVVALGSAPEIHYAVRAGARSNKAGVHWVHETPAGGEPILAVDPRSEGTMLVLPTARTRVTDWIYD